MYCKGSISGCPSPSATLTFRAARPHGISRAMPQSPAVGTSSWGHAPDTWDRLPAELVWSPSGTGAERAVAELQPRAPAAAEPTAQREEGDGAWERQPCPDSPGLDKVWLQQLKV